MKHWSIVVVVGLFLAAVAPAFGLSFNFNPAGGMSQEAIDGFAEAGARWSAFFSDDVTVNIDIDFATLGTGILGSASSSKVTYSYSSTRNALINDSTTSSDATAVSSLQSTSDLDLLINRTSNNPNGAGSATTYLDNDGDANNTTIRITRANAKALGLLTGNNPTLDASISFNDYYNWDFDASDGITSGAFDFVGIATHEIGHALGFVSGVDILDYNSSNPYFPDDAFTYVSTLDLFRFSDDSLEEGAGVIDWTADTRNKYFSIDGGSTDLGRFATGKTWGDGRQASHWKDGLSLGIMDPTVGPTEELIITDLDVLAFDVIGWDLNMVPEPSTVILILTALPAVVLFRRRRR